MMIDVGHHSGGGRTDWPPPNLASQHYNLRLTSSHNRQLPTRSGHLADANFITRLLYKDCY